MGNCRTGGLDTSCLLAGVEVVGAEVSQFAGLLTGNRGNLLVAASNFCVK